MMEPSSAVTISVCSEQDQHWHPLVSVPVTVGAAGKIHAPIAAAIRDNKKEDELTKLRGGGGLFSVKREFEGSVAITTYLPLKNVHFEFGKATPVDAKELQRNVTDITAKLKMIIDGSYHCVAWQQTRPVVYVVGHTDTVGPANANRILSETRARVIAQAIRAELHAEVEVCSAGVGEAEATTADDVPFPEARKADVMITSAGRPFNARWHCFKAGGKKP